MFKNYIKTALRSLIKDRVYSFINVFGLAIGICASLLICMYVMFERSYDQYHTNKDQIYRLRVEGTTDAGEMQFQSARCFPIVGPMVKELYPEIREQSRFVQWEVVVSYIDDQIDVRKEFWEEKVSFADSEFMDIFNIDITKGNRDSFNEAFKVFISESMAIKYFGDQEPIGKVIKIDNTHDVEVVGVFADVPKNSHLKYDFLINYGTLGGGTYDTNWGWNGFFTYLILEEGTDTKALESKFVELIYKHKGDYFRSTEYHENLLLQPLSSIHLYSNFEDEAEVNGNYKSVSYLSILAVFIIIIAWVNYVNLTTAKAINRAKEVGIRKTTGATKSQLIIQFLTESALINFAALLLALTFAQTCVPVFADLLDGNFVDSIFEYEAIVLGVIGYWIFSSVLSGLYPAFVLSSYNPILTLKGNYKSSSKGQSLRKSLIVFQFTTSIILVAATYVVYNQVQYMRKVDLGADINQKLVVKGPNSLPDSIQGEPVFDHFYRIMNTKLQSNPEIESMTISESIPGSKIYEWGGYIRRKGAPHTEARAYYLLGVSPNYIDFFDFELLGGRSFDEDLVSDHHSLVLNEEAIYNLGFSSVEEAVGSEIYFPFGHKQDETSGRIIGVVKNYHQMSLRTDYKSMIYHLENTDLQYFTFNINQGTYNESVSFIEAMWKESFPNTPFDFFFLDNFFDRQYKSDVRFGTMFSIFSGLSLIIACMGMFGLISYSVIQRTKEVGIRKALGAPLSSLVLLLSNELFKLLMIASILAVPISYYALNEWLLEFPFRIEIQWWYFVLPILMVLAIAMMSVGYKIVKSAMSNPVDSLRYE